MRHCKTIHERLGQFRILAVGGNAHEGIALYDYPEGVALRIPYRKVEGPKL